MKQRPIKKSVFAVLFFLVIPGASIYWEYHNLQKERQERKLTETESSDLVQPVTSDFIDKNDTSNSSRKEKVDSIKRKYIQPDFNNLIPHIEAQKTMDEYINEHTNEES